VAVSACIGPLDDVRGVNAVPRAGGPVVSSHGSAGTTDWLRADLGDWRGLLDKGTDKAGAMVNERMQHWLRDPDFNGVRGGGPGRTPRGRAQGMAEALGRRHGHVGQSPCENKECHASMRSRVFSLGARHALSSPARWELHIPQDHTLASRTPPSPAIPELCVRRRRAAGQGRRSERRSLGCVIALGASRLGRQIDSACRACLGAAASVFQDLGKVLVHCFGRCDRRVQNREPDCIRWSRPKQEPSGSFMSKLASGGFDLMQSRSSRRIRRRSQPLR
jgi:hypothetical protein